MGRDLNDVIIEEGIDVIYQIVDNAKAWPRPAGVAPSSVVSGEFRGHADATPTSIDFCQPTICATRRRFAG